MLSGRAQADESFRLPYFQGAGDRHERGLRCVHGGQHGWGSAEQRLQRIAGRDVETGEGLAYLSHTGLRLGLLLNFKYAKLQWKRVVR